MTASLDIVILIGHINIYVYFFTENRVDTSIIVRFQTDRERQPSHIYAERLYTRAGIYLL